MLTSSERFTTTTRVSRQNKMETLENAAEVAEEIMDEGNASIEESEMDNGGKRKMSLSHV